ncbi:MAG: MFS transporter [Steroidobacteraceae bacterium]|nr:MFS transporter [Steroidobacteraceae bacterium]
MTQTAHGGRSNIALIKTLTYLMFMMFAMTTDSVGVIIPQIIREFRLSMAQASSFQYVTMLGIAIAGLLLGFLADRIGRKRSIVLGLVLFTLNSYLFVIGDRFAIFIALLFFSGCAIGIFKTGALALIGDICTSTAQHTSTMNMVEGFFGVGSIIGPAIVIRLVAAGVSWEWLYVIVATVCASLVVIALLVKYPSTRPTESEPVDLVRTMKMLKDPYVVGFSAAAFFYVATECAIYVWMPTLLAKYHGSATLLAAYALSVFFILRAAGRFLGGWLIAQVPWAGALALLSLCIFLCFLGSVYGGINVAVYLLPASGLFMSVIYPTVNSKGISCFEKSEHGAVAGVILFFTCAGAAVGPFLMGLISDHFGTPRYGFLLATGYAAVLFVGLAANWSLNPARARLQRLDISEYAAVHS